MDEWIDACMHDGMDLSWSSQHGTSIHVWNILSLEKAQTFLYLKNVDLSFLLKYSVNVSTIWVFHWISFFFERSCSAAPLSVCLSVTLSVHQYAHRVRSHFDVQPCDFTVQPGGTDQIYRYITARLMRGFRLSLHSCTRAPRLLH